MRRRLFNLLAALSLLLSLGLASLWWRSLRTMDVISWTGEGGGYRLASLSGTLHAGRASRLMHPTGLRWTTTDLPPGSADWAWLYPGQRALDRRLGFARVTGNYDLGRAWVPYCVYVIPDWSLLCLTLLLPAVWLLRFPLLRRLRLRRGLCPSCGYDLRASADRCPECGTPITAAS